VTPAGVLDLFEHFQPAPSADQDGGHAGGVQPFSDGFGCKMFLFIGQTILLMSSRSSFAGSPLIGGQRSASVIL
jgi:hypothetical protein